MGRVYATAAVAHGRVFIGSLDGRVYAFSTRNGHRRWSHTTGSYVYASAAVSRGKVFVGSYDGRFYALEREERQRALEPQHRRPDLRLGDRDREHRLLLRPRPPA